MYSLYSGYTLNMKTQRPQIINSRMEGLEERTSIGSFLATAAIAAPIAVGAAYALPAIVCAAEPGKAADSNSNIPNVPAPILGDANQAPAALAQPTEKTPDYSIKGRGEETLSRDDAGRDSFWFRSTLDACGLKDQSEVRIYDNQIGKETPKGEVHEHYISGGIRSPLMDFGGTKNLFVLYGNEGDKEGAGIETKHLIGNFGIGLTAEQASKTKFQGESTRLGFGLDYKINDWLTAGAGFDTVETSSGVTNYYTGKLFAEATKADRVGVGFRSAVSEVDTLNSVIADWMHSGKNEAWGTRSFARFDWNNDTNYRSGSLVSILAQNPTFIRGDFTWFDSAYLLEDRGNGGLLAPPSSVEDPINTETPFLNRRADHGFVGQFLGKWTDAAGIHSSSLRGDIGYTFSAFDLGGFKIKPGAVIFDQYDAKDGTKPVNKYGTSFIVDFGKVFGGNVAWETTASQSSNSASDFFTGFSWTRRW